MARIHCELCIKTFRSDSGFAWHRRHIHDQETAPDEIRDSESQYNQSINVQGSLKKLELLEEEVSAISIRLNTDAAGIDAWHQHMNDYTDRVTRLEERLETVIHTLGLHEQLHTQMDEDKLLAASLASDVVAMKEVLASLSAVLWNLDLDHKADRTFRDIPTRPSKATLGKAKDVVRNYAQMENPDWISDQVSRILDNR